MPLQVEAVELVAVGSDPSGRTVYLAPEAARAWEKMKEAAWTDGVHLVLISGFRSVARQAEIVRAKLDRGMPLEDILKVNAYPGFSEHHTGNAIDVTTPGTAALTPQFAESPAYAWLREHAASFYFHLSYPEYNTEGIVFEPWHWCHRTTSRA